MTSLLFVAFILVTIVILFYFFYNEIAYIVRGIPSFGSGIIDAFDQALSYLEQLGIQVPPIHAEAISNWISEHMAVLAGVLSFIGKEISSMILTCVYLFFLLYYRDNYLYYLKLKYPAKESFAKAKTEVKEVVVVISNFLQGLLLMTLILAIILYLIFLVLGLEFPMFFAVFVALLALIPYIGNPLGMAVVFVYTLLTNDGLLIPLLVLAGLVLANMVKSYVIKPLIIGNKINLNAFMIFISVISGGLIWGVSGMILFMPFAGITKIILESNDYSKPFAAFFGVVPEDVLEE